jgi:CRP-like cAMP-binding protein
MVNYLWDNFFRRDSTESSELEVLRNTYLFATLSRKELSFVKQTVHVRSYRPGEIVFRQGELGIGMYIIYKGATEIFVENALSDPGAAQNILVTRLTDGDFMGELSLIEHNSRRSATAIVSEETTLIGFFKPDLMEILERQPATGVKILLRLSEILGRRLKETTIKVTELKRELGRLGENYP